MYTKACIHLLQNVYTCTCNYNELGMHWGCTCCEPHTMTIYTYTYRYVSHSHVLITVLVHDRYCAPLHMHPPFIINTCTCINMPWYMYTCSGIYTHMQWYIYTHAVIYIHTCSDIYIYIYIYIYILYICGGL